MQAVDITLVEFLHFSWTFSTYSSYYSICRLVVYCMSKGIHYTLL